MVGFTCKAYGSCKHFVALGTNLQASVIGNDHKVLLFHTYMLLCVRTTYTYLLPSCHQCMYVYDHLVQTWLSKVFTKNRSKKSFMIRCVLETLVRQKLISTCFALACSRSTRIVNNMRRDAHVPWNFYWTFQYFK